MIDNIILILKLAISNPSISLKELEEECNPLGMLPDHIMRAIASFENTPKGFQELFQIVLIEIPVGKYFCRYLDEQTENHMLHGAKLVKSLLEDSSIALMEQGVKKYYLEDFYYWTQAQGGYTAEMMGDPEDEGRHDGDQSDPQLLQHRLQRRSLLLFDLRVAQAAQHPPLAAALDRVFVPRGRGAAEQLRGRGQPGPRAGQVLGVQARVRDGDPGRADVGG